MIFAGFFGFLAMLLGTGDPAPAAPIPTVRMMTVEREMILRVPVRPHPDLRIRWDEEKGPKCIPVGAIAGAMLSGSDTIDLALRNHQRLRARLDSDCEGLDFYGGVYIQTGDDRVCAGRDVIRSRIGGSCKIEKFRMLVPRVER